MNNISPQILEQAISKAYGFLANNLPANRIYPTFLAPARQMCRLDLEIYELFSTALIAEALSPQNALRKKILEAYYLIAKNNVLLTFYPNSIYPPDTDTNSLVYSLLLEQGFNVQNQAQSVINAIEKFMTPEQIVQVWLSDERLAQTDPIVSINAEVLAVRAGLNLPNRRNRHYIINHLTSGNYWNGTRYYHSPDAFLYFLVRLAKMDEKFNLQLFNDLQRAALDRQQATCYPLDLAFRIVVLHWCGLDYKFELEQLLQIQQADGSIPADAFFHFGGIRGYFGSQYITTAFFIKALETIKK